MTAQEYIASYEVALLRLREQGADTEYIRQRKQRQARHIARARRILGKPKRTRATREEMACRRVLEYINLLQ